MAGASGGTPLFIMGEEKKREGGEPRRTVDSPGTGDPEGELAGEKWKGLSQGSRKTKGRFAGGKKKGGTQTQKKRLKTSEKRGGLQWKGKKSNHFTDETWKSSRQKTVAPLGGLRHWVWKEEGKNGRVLRRRPSLRGKIDEGERRAHRTRGVQLGREWSRSGGTQINSGKGWCHDWR